MNEFAIIDRFAAILPRPALLRNALHESDCELLDLPSGDTTLALTTDDLVEELALGLYPDPFTIGWVALTASLSDLAAVGADPLAALVSLGIPPDLEAEFLDGVAQGLAEVCRANGLGIAGGDTNATPEFRIGCTAVGTVPKGAALTRRGCRPGDRVFTTGPLGGGALVALAGGSVVSTGGGRVRPLGGGASVSLGRAGANATPIPAFRPIARLAEGRSLRGLAGACIDTSDGALDALGRLARVNGVGFDLDLADARSRGATGRANGRASGMPGVFDPSAVALLEARGLPAWLLLASLHGEFELLFTVESGLVGELDRVSLGAGWRPIALGTATERPGIRVIPSGASGPAGINPGAACDPIDSCGDKRPFFLDPLAVRALYEGYDGDLQSLITGLLALAKP